MDSGTMMSDLLNRGWVFWMFALAFVMSLLGGSGGPPPSGSTQLAFDFMASPSNAQSMAEVEKRSRIPRLQRFYPYATPFGSV